MKRTVRLGLVAFFLVALTGSGWAASELKTDFSGSQLNAPYLKGDYRAKVDYFILVQDASWSMNWKDKFSEGRDLANQVNYTMPKMDLKSGIYTFGESRVFFGPISRKVWGIDTYSRGDFENGLRSIVQGLGGTRVYKALNAVDEDLKNQPAGRVAVLIISDGETINEAAAINAVRTLKQDFGDKLCLYTAQIGDSAYGQGVLDNLVKEAGCGKTVKAADIKNQAAMDAFVAQMLLQKGVKKAPKDSDGDGVFDEFDQCPGTPKGTVVDENGCPIKPKNVEVTKDATWVVKDNVLFDFDKAELKPSAAPVLDEIAKIMNDNAALKIKISGHTDSVGSAAYNEALSLKRAKAVSAYIEAKNVAAERLSVEGLGFAKPAADNATAEGRAKNRRVEFTPSM